MTSIREQAIEDAAVVIDDAIGSGVMTKGAVTIRGLRDGESVRYVLGGVGRYSSGTEFGNVWAWTTKARAVNVSLDRDGEFYVNRAYQPRSLRSLGPKPLISEDHARSLLLRGPR